MEFWPLGVGILISVAVAVSIMVLMILTQRSGVVSKGPRHRWNRERDVASDEKRRAAERDRTPSV